jgi:hypothetical protein
MRSQRDRTARPRIHTEGMKRLVFIGLIGLAAMIGFTGAAQCVPSLASGTPAPAVTPRTATPVRVRHHRHHPAHAARHDAALASRGAPTDGGQRPAHRHGSPAPRHRATVPSLARTARAERHPRADGRSPAAVHEIAATQAQEAAMVQAHAPRVAAAAAREVGSGRAPPRAGPTDESEPPPAPHRIPASAPPAPLSVARRPSLWPPSRPRESRVRREASLWSATPAVPPARRLAASSVVPTRPVLDRLPACRSEGTAAGSSMPS